ncbi:MAG: hypothetical protein ACD_54C01269G0003 [uncultured bacterium]|nr:MAG: hypothetical protein ACD_54C01269G0003 [uncultured bacterium]
MIVRSPAPKLSTTRRTAIGRIRLTLAVRHSASAEMITMAR